VVSAQHKGRTTTYQLLRYSFPVQLFFVQLKKTPVLLLFWLLLFAISGGAVGSGYGIHLLFMDPEYLGQTGLPAHFLVGFACGGFIIAYNISSYVHHAFRFPFLATLSHPFIRYVYNNTLIPLLFVGYYIFHLNHFSNEQSISTGEFLLYVCGWLAGIVAFIIPALYYFKITGTDFERSYGSALARIAEPRVRRVFMRLNRKSNKYEWITITPGKEARDWHVTTYFAGWFRLRYARPFEHYDKQVLNRVFKQNHSRAVYFQVVVVFSLIILGMFSDIKYFVIPAAASLTLLFTLYIMFTAILRTWFRGWSAVMLVFVFVTFHFIYQLPLFHSNTQIAGIDYDSKVLYNDSVLLQLAHPDLVRNDSLHTISILNQWHEKVTTADTSRPTLFLVACSGGGIRSMLWSSLVLHDLEEQSKNQLLNHTVLISGSSGGAIGAAYYRSNLFQDRNLPPDLLAADMLNPLAYSMAVNDLFFPIRSYEYQGQQYTKNRAAIFESHLVNNSKNALGGRLVDYAKAEQEAKIPMLMLTPTIVNDGRKLIISAQPSSYLIRVNEERTNCDGVEFSRLLKQNNASEMLFSSALRMSATFPFVTPLTDLPTEPAVQVIDAGMRDNYGIDNLIQFMRIYRAWLEQHVERIVIVEIRDRPKSSKIKHGNKNNVVDAWLTPVTGVYKNLFDLQDFNNTTSLQGIQQDFTIPIETIEFCLERNPGKDISLSWHLTAAEKVRVKQSLQTEANRKATVQFRNYFPEFPGSNNNK